MTGWRHCRAGPGMVGRWEGVGFGGRCLLGQVLVVDAHVTGALVAAGESPATHLARERLLARVRPHVGRQVVAAAERAPADGARKRALSGVDAQMPRQFV